MLPDINSEFNNIAQQWYDAAQNDIGHTKQVELYQNTKQVIKTLQDLRASGQTDKVINLSQILIDKFQNHDVAESKKLAQWIARHTKVESNEELSGAYEVLHQLFQLIGDINEYPQAHLSNLNYDSLEFLKNDQNVIPKFVDEQKVAFSDLNLKSLGRLGETSSEYNELTKLMIIDRMNRGEVTLKSLGLKTVEQVIAYFGENCAKISNLNFKFCKNIKLEDMGRIASAFPNLKHLLFTVEGINEKNAQNLTQFKELVTLDLTTRFQDVHILTFPKSLISLKLNAHKNNIENLNQLKNCPELKKFSIVDSSALTDIEGIQHCSTLEVLELGLCRELKDVDALKKCPSLKTLALSESKVSDLSVLKSLPSLKELSITKNPIINFEFLQDCKSLIKLNISGLTIKKEDSKFFNLPHLTSLNVNGSKINDDDFFTNFPELKTMDCGVSRNETNDLSFLKDLPNLTEFKCQGRIASFSPLENCKNVAEIKITSPSIRDANFISYFPNIQTVDLSTCQNLVDIGFLEDSSSLKTLIIKFCAKVPAQQIEKLRSKGVTVVTS
jgi:hypothetical protein